MADFFLALPQAASTGVIPIHVFSSIGSLANPIEQFDQSIASADLRLASRRTLASASKSQRVGVCLQ